jgi:hypothetical protein
LTPIYSRKRAEIANFDDTESQPRQKSKKKRPSLSDPPPEPPQKESSLIKEIPTNPFDFIWDTDNMLPKKDAPPTDHTKTALGATVAKLDENDRITTIAELMNTSVNEYLKTGQKKTFVPPKEDLSKKNDEKPKKPKPLDSGVPKKASKKKNKVSNELAKDELDKIEIGPVKDAGQQLTEVQGTNHSTS